MMVGLYKTTQQRGAQILQLAGYGNGVSVVRVQFEIDREALIIIGLLNRA